MAFQLAWLLLAMTAVAAVSAAPTCTSSLPSSTVIASFPSSAQFAARLSDLGTAFSDNGTMTTFAYDGALGAVTVRPASVNSVWFVSTLPIQQNAVLSLADTAGAVLAFDLAPGDPALFSVQLVAQTTAANVTSATKFTVPVQLYANATGTTVRIPVQHFGIPASLPVLADVLFTKFPSPYGASAPPVRFDNLRLEYNPCPRKLTLLPPQTCTTSALVVEDFSSASRFATNKNALGGTTSSQFMTAVTYLPSTNPLGQGVQLAATRNDSYWATNLVSPATGGSCLVAWPYTTLRLQLAASLGASFAIELRRTSSDCKTALVNYITQDSSYYVNFTGVNDVYTVDIPLAKLARNPYASVAVSSFYRRPGAPTDGKASITVVVHSISFLRDCASLANDAVELRPPVFDWCGPSDVPKVALSFDGPADYTEAILDYFRAEGIRATFFHQPGLIVDRLFDDPANYDSYGYALQPGPDSENCRIVRRVVNEGHSLGDHTYTHPRYGLRRGLGD